MPDDICIRFNRHPIILANSSAPTKEKGFHMTRISPLGGIKAFPQKRYHKQKAPSEDHLSAFHLDAKKDFEGHFRSEVSISIHLFTASTLGPTSLNFRVSEYHLT